MILPFHPEHLAYFRTCLSAGGERSVVSDWPGPVSPHAWAKDVTGVERSMLFDEPQNRDAVFAALPGLDDEDAWLTIMAWGGQRRDSGRNSWADRARWAPIVHDLRSGAIDALEAYSRFSETRIKGTGPAYFTKAIFFLQTAAPDRRGYIMDQWTAKSMELLQAPDPAAPIVHWDGRVRKIRRDGSSNWQAVVSRRNEVEVYDRFCRFVRHLADTLEREADHVEEAMFAGGDADWRRHTMAHWTPPPRKGR